MKNRIIFLILFFIISLKPVTSFENKILIQINNEIITTIDISNEIKYLEALNKNIKNLEENVIIQIAKNSLIKQKIKKIELYKNINELTVEPKYLNYLITKTYSNIGLNNVKEFEEHLDMYGLKIDSIKERIKVDTVWKQLIYTKYKNQIKIDKKKITNEVTNKKTKIFKLSEILFKLDKDENLVDKFEKIKKSISKNGFENAALIYSLSDSSNNGGNLGWINSNAISANILNKLSSININEFTNPIIVPSGFLILKISDFKEEKNLGNIKEEVEKIINNKVNEQINQYSNLYINKLKKDTIINEL